MRLGAWNSKVRPVHSNCLVTRSGAQNIHSRAQRSADCCVATGCARAEVRIGSLA